MLDKKDAVIERVSGLFKRKDLQLKDQRILDVIK
jgi:hypothetical protein